MSNTKNHAHLSDQKMLTIVIGLCVGIAKAKTAYDAAELMTAILTPQETRTIAIRLKIREMLKKGCGYDHIKSDLSVSTGTISRVKLTMEQMDRRPKHTEGKPDVSGILRNDQSSDSGSGNARVKPSHKHVPYEEGMWPIELLGNLFRAVFAKDHHSGK